MVTIATDAATSHPTKSYVRQPQAAQPIKPKYAATVTIIDIRERVNLDRSFLLVIALIAPLGVLHYRQDRLQPDAVGHLLIALGLIALARRQ